MTDFLSKGTPVSKQATEIVYAGGTISAIATIEGYREGGHVIDLIAELKRRVPTFQERFNVGIPAVAYTGLSENIEPKYWESIADSVASALKRGTQAIIITHGTDSMEQTARYLRGKFLRAIKRTNTKIILTGANDDILHPKTDAWENLVFSFEAAARNVPPDVYIAFGGKLVSGNEAVKEPFSGRGVSYASYKDPNYKASLTRLNNHAEWLREKIAKQFVNIEPDLKRVVEYDVNIVRADHREFLAYLENHATRAILLNLYHSGTANAENPRMSVAKLVKKLRMEKKIVSFVVTENGTPVDLREYETSVQMRLAGAVPLYNMPRAVAVAKLQYLVKPNISPQELIQEMLKPRSDDIDKNLIRTDDIRQLLKLYKS